MSQAKPAEIREWVDLDRFTVGSGVKKFTAYRAPWITGSGDHWKS